MRLAGGSRAGGQGRGHHHGGRQSGYREHNSADSGRIDRAHLVRLLESKNLLPAIFFIFSRAGCDKAVANVLRAGVRLTSASERDEIRAHRRGTLPHPARRGPRRARLLASGSRAWSAASPHTTPGCCPRSRKSSRSSSSASWCTAVFATETLALGINMPARTVVLEKLEKFNGEARVPITPGEYTQLTGRAGPARHRRRSATR